MVGSYLVIPVVVIWPVANLHTLCCCEIYSDPLDRNTAWSQKFILSTKISSRPYLIIYIYILQCISNRCLIQLHKCLSLPTHAIHTSSLPADKQCYVAHVLCRMVMYVYVYFHPGNSNTYLHLRTQHSLRRGEATVKSVSTHCVYIPFRICCAEKANKQSFFIYLQ